MIVLFQYSLAVSITLFVMWIIYRLLFAGRRTYNANRLTIMLIYFVSLLLYPLLAYFNLPADNVPVKLISPAVDNSGTYTDWLSTLTWIWLSGTVVCIIITLIGLLKIMTIIRHSMRTAYKGKTLCVSESFNRSPFSFTGYIVMNTIDSERDKEQILLHELGHVELRHSFDTFVAQLISIFCWYNPAVWMLRRELNVIHEYQADNYVLNNDIDPKLYQLMLIRQAIRPGVIPMTNDFSTSALQKRIAMMNNTATISATKYVRYILILPSIILAGFMFAIPTVRAIVTPLKKQTELVHANDTPTQDDVNKEVETGDNNIKVMDIYVDGKQIDKSRLNEVPANRIKQITIHKNNKNVVDIEMKK